MYHLVKFDCIGSCDMSGTKSKLIYSHRSPSEFIKFILEEEPEYIYLLKDEFRYIKIENKSNMILYINTNYGSSQYINKDLPKTLPKVGDVVKIKIDENEKVVDIDPLPF